MNVTFDEAAVRAYVQTLLREKYNTKGEDENFYDGNGKIRVNI